MAYNNFKQEFWSAHIQTELEKNCVLAAGCDYEFEGEIKKGNKLRILGVERPTINDYTGADQNPETGLDTAIMLEIDKAKNYFIAVDDIDKAQGKEGLMENLTAEGNKGLAEARDSAIAALAAGATNKSTATASVDSETEAMALIDAAFEKLYDNGVKLNRDLELILPPFMYTLVRKQIVTDLTDNPKVIRSGVVGKMNNAMVLMTNNLYTDGSGYSYPMLRTKKAIAFAGLINEVIPTSLASRGRASDAVLAIDNYGCRIVRQDELYVIRAKKTA